MTNIVFPSPEDLLANLNQVVNDCISRNLNRPIVRDHGEILGDSVRLISDAIILGTSSIHNLSVDNFKGSRPVAQYIGALLYYPELIQKLVQDPTASSIISPGSVSATRVESCTGCVVVRHDFEDDGVIARYINKYIDDENVETNSADGVITVIWTIPEESEDFNAIAYISGNMELFAKIYCKLLRYSLWQTCKRDFPKFPNS